MPVTYDYNLHRHPKIIAAGSQAAYLFLCGLAYCAEQLTDGFIPEAQVPFLGVANAKALARRLVEVRLWERVKGGYLSHEYTKHNPPADKVRAERDAARDRMRRARSGSNGGAEGTRDAAESASRSGEVRANKGRTFGRSSGEVQLPPPSPVVSVAFATDTPPAADNLPTTHPATHPADGEDDGVVAASETPSVSDRSASLRSGQLRSRIDIRDAAATPSSSPSSAASTPADDAFDEKKKRFLTSVRETAGLQSWPLSALDKVLQSYARLFTTADALLAEAGAFRDYNLDELGRNPNMVNWQRWLAQVEKRQQADGWIARGFCAECGAQREPGQRKYCIACEDERAAARQRGNDSEDQEDQEDQDDEDERATTSEALDEAAGASANGVYRPHDFDAIAILDAAQLPPDDQRLTRMLDLMADLMNTSRSVTVVEMEAQAQRWRAANASGDIADLCAYLGRANATATEARA